MKNTFSSQEEIYAFIKSKGKGALQIAHRILPDYEGMVLDIGIIYDVQNEMDQVYKLDLQWISYGLDLSGENLLENYTYLFNSLENLLEYLQVKFDINVLDIQKQYTIDHDSLPNPIKDKDKAELYRTDFKKFQIDFKKGKFKDDSLKLVYSTENLPFWENY